MNDDDLEKAASEARFAHPTTFNYLSATGRAADSPYAKGVRMTIWVAVVGVVVLAITFAATRTKSHAPAAGPGKPATTAPAVSQAPSSADAESSTPTAVVPAQIPGSRTFGTPADAISVQMTVLDNDHVRVVCQNRDGRAILGIELVMVAPADPNGNVGSVSIPGLGAMQKMDVVVPVDSIGQRLPIGPVEVVKITGARFAASQ